MNEITANADLDIEKEFKIEAGPGAGKTRFLIYHISNVLRKSQRLYSARRVLCITFTNTAVDTIRQRLGSGAIEKVEVSTIHSFLYNNIVKPYGRYLLEEYGLRIEKVDGHEETVVNRNFLNQWLKMDVLAELKHPNSQKQLEKRPDLTAALKNWLLSERCIIRKGNIEWDFDNDKAVTYTANRRIALNRNCFEILKSGFIEYKKLYWEKGVIDHEDVLFFSAICTCQQKLDTNFNFFDSQTCFMNIRILTLIHPCLAGWSLSDTPRLSSLLRTACAALGLTITPYLMYGNQAKQGWFYAGTASPVSPALSARRLPYIALALDNQARMPDVPC